MLIIPYLFRQESTCIETTLRENYLLIGLMCVIKNSMPPQF